MTWSFNNNKSTVITIEEKKSHREHLFIDTIQKNNDRVIDRIKRYNLDVNDDFYLDDCQQNLLHITTRTGNIHLTQQLINIGMNLEKRNIFGETPLDIAIQRNDSAIVKCLLKEENGSLAKENQVLNQENRYLTQENSRLITKNKEYELNNKRLFDSNKDLTNKFNANLIILQNEQTKNKRLCDDLDFYVRDNKRLKQENIKLKEDNLVLQDTIKNLRNNNRK